MKRAFLLLWLFAPALLHAQIQPAKAKVYDLLVGTYTTGASKGIYVYHFDSSTGKLSYLNEVDGVNNPSYLAVSVDRRFVYSVNEVGTDRKGDVSAFAFNVVTGSLTFLNKQPSVGAGPCYIATDKAANYVFVANYAGGSLSVLPVAPDGTLKPAVQTIQNEGHGPNPARQEHSHVHTATLSPDEKYLLFTDLGTDKLNIYSYNPQAAQPLSPATTPFVSVTPGNGPRHLAFSPNGKFLYLIQEMGAVLNVYAYNNGTLSLVQSQTLVAEGFKGQVGAADIHFSPDGRYLYTTNRGDANELEVFAVDAQSGKLQLVQRTSTLGKTPRNFSLSPDGNYLLVANQNSDDIYVFAVDKSTGMLTYTGTKLTIGNPSCLKFVEVQ